MSSISPDNSTSLPTDIEDDHGFTVDGNDACCRRSAFLGLVDCAACLNESWSGFIEHLSPEERDDAQWVIDTVRQAGAAGVRKSKLMVRLVLKFITLNVGLCVFRFQIPPHLLVCKNF